jgi:hypothetical protein
MPEYKPHARVAHRNSRRIHEVDGAPATHTEPGWHNDWEVTDRPSSAPPLPFSDKPGVPAVIAVPIMLIVTMSAFVTSMAVVTAGHRHQVWIIVGGSGAIVFYGFVLSIPAMVMAARNRRTERTGR